MPSRLTRDLENLEAKEPTLFDRTFRDSEGNIVIAQMPNLPILVGFTATLLQFVLPSGKIQAAFGLQNRTYFGTPFSLKFGRWFSRKSATNSHLESAP